MIMMFQDDGWLSYKRVRYVRVADITLLPPNTPFARSGGPVFPVPNSYTAVRQRADMDITDGQALRARFAETYAREDYPHPLRQFEQYELVMAHREMNPTIGSKGMTAHIDLPASRIKSWLQGSKPTGYEATQQVAELGWFDLAWDGEQFRGLVELVAWIFSRGSVNDSYSPSWTLSEASREVCTVALERAGVSDYAVIETDGERREQLRAEPQGDRAILGRLLVALGAPQGRKTDQQFGLPCWLGRAPDAVRRRFAAIYLLNRGVRREGKDHLIVREERPAAYLEALAGLFRSLTEASVNVGTDYRVRIGDAVLSDIEVPKKFE
jgi:hypothetical protein